MSYARSQLIGHCAGERRHAEERAEAERRRGAPRARAAVRSIPGVQPQKGRRPVPSAFLGVGQERPGVESHGVEERWREIEGRLEPPLLIFAMLTTPAIALDYGDPGEPWHSIGIVLNWMIWLAFVAEVVIMLRVVPDRGAGCGITRSTWRS
jgi:hypothetical protein